MEKKKGKEYSYNDKLIFGGEYLKGKKWNIKSFDVNNNIQYEIKNGKGYIIQKSLYNGKK